jgi:hypothetical protein
MRPTNLAKITSATATSLLPTVHGFDEYFGNLITSTPRMSPNTRTVRKILRSERNLVPTAS